MASRHNLNSKTDGQDPGEPGKSLITHYLGRPSIYPKVWTQETKERVLKECAQGAGVVELCVEVLGILPDRFYEWLGAKGKEDFTHTMQVGYYLAKSWWMKQGRINLTNREFNTRLFELNMRNRYDWFGMNQSERLPHGSVGGEEDEAAGVRDLVDVDAIISEAQKYEAVEVEYTDVKEPAPPPRRKKASKKAAKKVRRGPPIPPGLRGKKKAGKKSGKKAKRKKKR